MKNLLIILLLPFTLSACGQQHSNQSEESFSTFFQKFKSSPTYQMKHIVFPITISSWEGEMGEEVTKTETNYSEKTWTFDDFVILNEKYGVMEITEESKGYKKIMVGYEASDVLSYYIFKKIGGQWYLTRIDG